MTFEEIARREHISPSQAEFLFERGMEKLRKQLPGKLIVEGINILHDLDFAGKTEYSIAR